MAEKARSWLETLWPILALSLAGVLFLRTELVELRSNQEHMIQKIKTQDRSMEVERIKIQVERLEARVYGTE